MNAMQKEAGSEITELLLQAGADLTARDARGKTALAHAIERDFKNIIAVLREHGATES